MGKVLTKDNPGRKKRDVTIANDRLAGMTYAQIAAKHGISKPTVHRALKDDEIKEIVETSTAVRITQLPRTDQVYQERLEDKERPDLQLKAAQDIRKAVGILPSNVINQRITNVFNQQNNLITAQTMDLVKKILPGFKGEPKEINPDAA